MCALSIKLMPNQQFHGQGEAGLGELGRGGETVFYEEQGVQYEEDGSDEEVDDDGVVELVDENERAQDGTKELSDFG